MKHRIVLLALTLVFFVGCVLSDGGPGLRYSQVSIALMDSPDLEITEVNIRVVGVNIKLENESWQVLSDLSDTPLDVNLLELRFDEQLLGEKNLPAGVYEQIRVVVDDGDVAYSNVVINGVKEYLKVPSGSASGLKIDHSFVVAENSVTALLLDADVRDFIHKAGESGMYIMNPHAIRVIDKTISGHVQGQVVRLVDQEPAGIGDVPVYLHVYDQAKKYLMETLAVSDEDSDLLDKDPGSFQLNGLVEDTDYYLKVEVEGYKMALHGYSADGGETYTLDDDGFLLLAGVAKAMDVVQLPYQIVMIPVSD